MKKYLNKEFLIENKQTVLKAAAILLIFAVAFVVFVIKDNGGNDEAYLDKKSSSATEEKEAAAETEETIIVDISGAVKTPAVVELPKESRIQDAIDAAGGLKKNADISNVNRAAIVNDGEKIIIPASVKSASSRASLGEEPAASGGSKSNLININSATSDELQTLTGIGPALASRIIEYREQNGSFQKIEEIKEVKGIGDKTFADFKDKITV